MVRYCVPVQITAFPSCDTRKFSFNTVAPAKLRPTLWPNAFRIPLSSEDCPSRIRPARLKFFFFFIIYSVYDFRLSKRFVQRCKTAPETVECEISYDFTWTELWQTPQSSYEFFVRTVWVSPVKNIRFAVFFFRRSVALDKRHDLSRGNVTIFFYCVCIFYRLYYRRAATHHTLVILLLLHYNMFIIVRPGL